MGNWSGAGEGSHTPEAFPEAVCVKCQVNGRDPNHSSQVEGCLGWSEGFRENRALELPWCLAQEELLEIMAFQSVSQTVFTVFFTLR